jgi:DNA-binding MarR family transcriptional regulator
MNEPSDFDVGHQNLSVESRIVAALERIAQAFRVLLWQESKEFSLTPIQVQLLIFLLYHSSDKCKVSYLASEFNLTKATISDAVKALQEKGLITKAHEAADTRSYVIRLTRKGKLTAGKIAGFSLEIRKPVDQLSADEKELLLLSLLNIIHHLNRKGIITLQRMCFACMYYRPSEQGAPHFCQLLHKPLARTELRIDCPEFEQA